MASHVKAFTYKPKIEAVRSGECTQTIRPEGSRPINKGDTITFHGWEDKPYRSKWSWRLKGIVTKADLIGLCKDGIYSMTYHAYIKDHVYRFNEWDSKYCNNLAVMDHIEPSTGVELGRLFNSMYKLPIYEGQPPVKFQVIRWDTNYFKVRDSSLSNKEWLDFLFRLNLGMRAPRDFLFYITGPGLIPILDERGLHPFDILMRYMNYYERNKGVLDTTGDGEL